jgi:hypothetical protein
MLVGRGHYFTPRDVEQFQAEGAWLLGTRVVKTGGEPGDVHPTGARGTVRGSVGQEEMTMNGRRVRHGYFIEWDDMPGVVVAVVDWKLGVLP